MARGGAAAGSAQDVVDIGPHLAVQDLLEHVPWQQVGGGAVDVEGEGGTRQLLALAFHGDVGEGEVPPVDGYGCQLGVPWIRSRVAGVRVEGDDGTASRYVDIYLALSLSLNHAKIKTKNS